MTSTPDTGPAGDDLQFDHAEFATTEGSAGVVCSSCRQPIADLYYEINGLIACAPCHARVREAFFGGSRLQRAITAAVLGCIAGAIGTGIYYGVAALTGYEIGLVAIVVGLLVGGAVRRGSSGRGGWFYQLMAVALTYASISGSYLIYAASASDEPGPSPTTQVAESASAATQTAEAGATSQPADAGQTGVGSTLGAVTGGLLVAVIVLVGISLALPVLVAIESPITILIVGFALYEAWRMNKRPALQINGPCQVGAGLPVAAGAPVNAWPSPDSSV